MTWCDERKVVGVGEDRAACADGVGWKSFVAERADAEWGVELGAERFDEDRRVEGDGGAMEAAREFCVGCGQVGVDADVKEWVESGGWAPACGGVLCVRGLIG